MKIRYKFPVTIQKRYFRRLESVSKLSPDQLASIAGIVPRTYRDWRRGKYAVPATVVNSFKIKFGIPPPIPEDTALQKWRTSKIQAAQTGGLALFRIHGSPATPEGRSRGGKKALSILRKKGIIAKEKPFSGPKHYSKKLAELVGILLGDGHIGHEQWSITLNAKADRVYADYVVSLIRELFTLTPSLLHRKSENVLVIYGGGLQAIRYMQKIGLVPGNKVKLQVGVPQWITQNHAFTKECVRGLIETDGGVFKHTYKINGKSYSYIKLCFTNRSMPLLYFVRDTLINCGYTPKLIDKVENKKVWLYNQQEVKRYIHEIGVHNPRMLVNIT